MPSCFARLTMVLLSTGMRHLAFFAITLHKAYSFFILFCDIVSIRFIRFISCPAFTIYSFSLKQTRAVSK